MLNVSGEEFYQSSRVEDSWFAAIYLFILIFSVPSNGLALWVFSHHTHSKTSAKVFLKHLAVADVSYALMLPLRVVYHLCHNHWPLGEEACRMAGFLFYVNLYCSTCLISCIALDRLLACLLPYPSQKLRTPRNANVICSGVWALVFASMVPVLFYKNTVITGPNVTRCGTLYIEKSSHTTGALVSTAVAFMVPLVSLTASYVLILCKRKKMTFQERTRVRVKAVKMIALTLAIFLITFVPYHVNRFVFIVQQDLPKTESQRKWLLLGNRITSALTCVSGVLDPVMYFFLARNYQETLLQLCGRKQRQNVSV